MTPPKEPPPSVLRWVAGVTGSVLGALVVAALAGIWGAVTRAESSTIRLEAQVGSIEARVAEVRGDLRAMRDSEEARGDSMMARLRVEVEAVERRCQQSIQAVVRGGQP
jgi:hypothetical protein